MQEKEQTYYRALYEAARVINSSLEPSKVLNTIAKQTASAMGVKACTLRLLDRQGEYLLPGASHGLSQAYLRKGKVALSGSKLDKVALSGEPVYIQCAATDPRFQYPEAAKAEGIVSLLVVPLMLEEKKAIGVMRVYSDVERVFSADETEFLTIMANLSAIALENARLHQTLKSDCELSAAYQFQTFED